MSQTVLEELIVQLGADTKVLKSAMADGAKIVADASSKMQKSVDDLAKGSEQGFSVLQGAAATAAGFLVGEGVLGAFNAVKEAAHKLFEVFVVEGIAAAQQQQDALNKLNSALASSGEYSSKSSKEFQEFAHQMQATTRFADEQVMANAALIQSLGNLSEKGLEKATLAAANLAAGLGIDLHTASELVGKAAAGEIGTFSRYGLVIQEGATHAQTFANALEVLNGRFAGRAAADVDTFSGRFTQLKNTFNDLQETFGNAVVENVAVTNTFAALSKIIEEFNSDTGGSGQALREMVAQGIIVAIQALQGLASGLDAVIRILNIAETAVATPFKILATEVEAATQAAQGNFGQAWETIKGGVTDAAKEVKASFVDDGPLTKIQDALAQVQHAAEKGFDAVKQGAIATVEPVNNTAAKIKELTEAQKRAAEAGEQLGKKLLEESLLGQKTTEAETQHLKDQLEDKLISEQAYFDQRLAMVNTDHDNEQALLEAAHNAHKLSDQQFGVATSALEGQRLRSMRTLQDEQTKYELTKSKEREANLKSSLGYIRSLMNSDSKELFRIGQAAAMAGSVIDGIAAVQKALASAPPPFNFALAAIVGVAAAANTAKIASAQPPQLASGIDSVPGTGFQDSFPAMLAPRERVVPAQTNQDLTSFLKSSGGATELLSRISQQLDSLIGVSGRSMSVSVDGKVVFNAVNDQLLAGRRFAA